MLNASVARCMPLSYGGRCRLGRAKVLDCRRIGKPASRIGAAGMLLLNEGTWLSSSSRKGLNLRKNGSAPGEIRKQRNRQEADLFDRAVVP